MSPKTTGQPASETVAPPARTLVLLCEGLAELGNGLDLDGIKQSLKNTPELRVEVVPDLCDRPTALAETTAEADDRAVVGLCSSNRSGGEFDYHARQAGLDPFGVATVNLGGLCARAHARDLATNKATVLLAAAVSRARAFPGSGPEHVKPRLGWSDGRVSRRALFTLPPITYQPVASVRANRCISKAGCDLCTVVCPRGALSVVGGKLNVDKSACDACGLCVTECPRDAVELPAASLREFEVELEALLTAPGLPKLERRAILCVCDRNVQVLEELAKQRLPYAAGWLPLRVPCTGMVSAGWILQSLALGASAVAVMACGGECAFEQRERTAATAAYCHDLLDLLGISGDRLRVLDPSSVTDLADVLNRPFGDDVVSDSPVPERACLREPTATASALMHLAEAGSGSVALRSDRSPLGVVRIDAQGCTACEACVRACPTDALACEKEGDGLAITFDPNLCTGCSLCARSCSEDVIQVEHVTDLEALSNGRTELYRDTQVRCEKCGVAFAPASMVRRVEQLLNDGGGSSPAIRRCPACRGIAIGASLEGRVQSKHQKEE